MKTNINNDIQYLNEALLLSSYIFNEESDNDKIIYFNMDELNISENVLKEKLRPLELFLINTREKSREISKDYSDLSDVFKTDNINVFPNIIYFIMYGKLEESIHKYSKEEFIKLINVELQDNLETFGDVEKTNDFVKLIDSINTFNNNQKFSLIKLIKNTNGYSDKLYDFISEIEGVIKDNIYIIEDLINDVLLKINLNYIKSLKEFDTVGKVIKDYKIEGIEISLRINLYEKMGFSVYEKNNKIYGEIYCGLISFLLKDYFKDEIDEKNDVFDILMAISDETRFKIIHLLNNKKMYGREIADSLDLTTGTVSHHLTKLISVNIVNSEVEGNRIYYILNHKITNYLSEYFKNILGGCNEK
ncbi:ArsR/SmtB family transcription factor [Helcococcus kunzii]|uniref:ArsR/SmtB family transcription factor n=1 Tax=Helcococcus kunzii TaxID=40091 RepID=UPI0024AE3E18|nr:metalloregulator ArsR/SmtB family transcription factor [Helcococcus kunzii]